MFGSFPKRKYETTNRERPTRIPGRIPAMNSFEMEALATTP
jgi:hypothetical protein